LPQLQWGNHTLGAAVNYVVIMPHALPLTLGDPNLTNTDTLNAEDTNSLSSNLTYVDGSSRDLQSSGDDIEEDGSEKEQISAHGDENVDTDGDIFGYKGDPA
jgi:hypothetical protein